MFSEIKIVMIITTCISDEANLNYIQLLQSCIYFNLNIVPIVHRGDWHTHRLKDVYFYEFLKGLDFDDIVFFTDGYDAVFTANKVEILEKFYSFNADIVFSAEINCYPTSELEAYYTHNVRSKYKYLNSGGMIGKVGALVKVYEEYNNKFFIFSKNEDFFWSNQYLWTKIFLENNYNIKLDYNCEIFQTFANSMDLFYLLRDDTISDQRKREYIDEEIVNILNDFDFSDNGRLLNKQTLTKPCHLHFNSIFLKEMITSGSFYQLFPWVKKV